MTSDFLRRYVRYESNGTASFGLLDGDTIRQLDGPSYDGGRPTGVTVRLAGVKLLVPVDPEAISKVIGMVDNYPKAGSERPAAAHPFISPKMQTSLITDGEAIEIPPESTHARHEGSLVLIIGREARNVSIADAPSYVFGVTAGNDVTEEDWLWRKGGNLVPDRILAKANDSWGPIGTTIVTGLDYNDLAIETKVNGRVAASGRTGDMINNVARLVHYISHYCTLLPGDVIYTGSPGVSDASGIKPGDTVAVTIEGVDTLTNPVVARKRDNAPKFWLEMLEQAKQAAG